MLYRSFFPRDLFADIERLQRQLDRNVGMSPSIRGGTRSYPAMNVGATATTVEVYAFAPGMNAADFDVQIEKGVLTVSGERKDEEDPQGVTGHIAERFFGRFRRVVSLPDDIDPNAVKADYRNGVLHVSVARKQVAQPRRITIQ